MKTLLTIYLLHVFADFTLQGLFGNLKSKFWWMDACNNLKGIVSKKVVYSKCKRDFMAGLLIHSAYWALITFFPIWYFCESDVKMLAVLVPNVAIHYFVDDLKANKLKINLIEDQLIHLGQIIVTFAAWRIFN